MAGWVSRTLSRLTGKAAGNRNPAGEGNWAGPFWGMGEQGGWYPFAPLGDGWQRNIGMRGRDASHVPIVYACVMVSARAVSLCYATHRRVTSGSHGVVSSGPVAEVLRNPNEHETWPQFILNVVAEMLFRGESLVIMSRDDAGTVTALHRVHHGRWALRVVPDTREVFYAMSHDGSPLRASDITALAPARDVIHFRMHTPRHPLVGESPIAAAALAVGINVSLSESQAAFFDQMRRPSGIISTDKDLTHQQIQTLRAAFDEQAKRWQQGGMPILASGLKFQPISINSQDSQLVEAQRMSIEDVCRVFCVPPPVVADLSRATLQNAEQLINNWLAIGLGSLLENIERSFDRAFKLPPNEYVELDVAALLRTDFVARVDGLSKAVTGGLFSPNEARAREGLPPVDGGESPFLQQQMIAINVAAKTNPSATPEPVTSIATESPKEEPELGKGIDGDVAAALVRDMIRRKAA